MDKSKRRAIMSKFLKKGTASKPQPQSQSQAQPQSQSQTQPQPQPQTQNRRPVVDNQGFYETLKTKPTVEQPTIKNGEICNKMGNISELTKKKYMIPSQFPNITQVHS